VKSGAGSPTVSETWATSGLGVCAGTEDNASVMAQITQTASTRFIVFLLGASLLLLLDTKSCVLESDDMPCERQQHGKDLSCFCQSVASSNMGHPGKLLALV
jgi:hypothetical protein